jgi:hypothetical protein
MTNNNTTDDLTAAIIASNARRLEQIARDREAFANPIMPATISRPAPKERNRYRRRRAIR